MSSKVAWVILVVSFSLVLAGHKHGHKSAPSRVVAPPSEMTLSMDSVFIKIQKEFDDVVASPIVQSKAVAPVNAHFFKILKEHQPFYSLTRVNAKGVLVNEVIRLVEKPNVKNQNLSKEVWVKRTMKGRKPYSGMVKLEETGRYYLLWAAPIIEKDKKGKEIATGSVALKIDLWDCFHKIANETETPFLVRLDKLHLYSNKWKDTISYREDALSIPGIKKISLRYPKVIPIAAPAAVALAPVQAQVASAVDSAKIKATQDSMKAAYTAQIKQKNHKKTVITIAVIAIIVILLALLFWIVPMVRQRMVMDKIGKDDVI
jgi:hypothetical protein